MRPITADRHQSDDSSTFAGRLIGVLHKLRRAIDMDLKTFRCKGGGHLLPPFHQNHGVLAGILKLFVESQRFKLIKKPVDAVLPGA